MKTRRFVLLRHQTPKPKDVHLDLLLEMEEALFSLKIGVADWPPSNFECTWENHVLARRQFDHRKKYLDYEGPISNDRGIVTQVASGTMSELPKQLKNHNLSLFEHGTLQLKEHKLSRGNEQQSEVYLLMFYRDCGPQV